ncbi:MAG: MFS transporter [Candidatus Nitrosocaldus sp.]|nr:MFS transporter [Candidatus Nitrosocaldus sp.]
MDYGRRGGGDGSGSRSDRGGNGGGMLLLLYTSALSMGIAYGAHVPSVPVFAREVLNATYTEVGMVGMANYLPYAFFPLIVGLLLDRLNKGGILVAGVGMALASIAMLSMTRNVLDLALIRAFSGVAHALFWPAAEAMISMKGYEHGDGNDSNHRGSSSSRSGSSDGRGGDSSSSSSSSGSIGTVRSISRFTMAWVVGYMVGPLIGSSLFHLGYIQLFIYSSAMVIPALVCSIMLVSRYGHSMNVRSRKEVGKGTGLTIFSMVKGRVMLIAMITYYSASFAVLLSIVPSYMKDNGVDEHLIGMLFFIFGVARLLTLFSIQIFARYEHISILIASGAIASSMLIMHATPTPYHFGVALLALGFAFSIYFPITLTMLTRNVPSVMIGSMVGLYETIFGVGWALGPLASGIVADALSIDAPYLALFIVGMVIIPLYLMRSLRDGTIATSK